MGKHFIEQIVKDEFCIGCGFCSIICKNKAIKIVYDKKYDGFIPKVVKDCDCEGENNCANFCPGNNLDLLSLVKDKFGEIPRDYLISNYESIHIGYSKIEKYRQNSSSGGLVPTILNYLFKSEKINGAYCVIPSNTSPYETSGAIIESIEEIDSIHGSVYHPVNFGKGLNDLLTFNGKFAFVGLPCQIEAFEKLKNKNLDIKERHYISIGLFCGGINKYEAFRYYLKSFGKNFDTIDSINFRHGQWPGNIKIRTNGEVNYFPRGFGNTRKGILRYAASVDGYFMMKRCRLCPDQIADLADIAVGDPHLPKYKSNRSAGYSLIISRSKTGFEIIKEMKNLDKLHLEKSNREDIVNSQSSTLNNRRHVNAYLRVSRLFRKSVPNFNLDERIEENTTKNNYFYAFRDLLKIYYFQGKFFQRFYLIFQIFDYLTLTINQPKIFFKRLMNISLYLKKVHKY